MTGLIAKAVVLIVPSVQIFVEVIGDGVIVVVGLRVFAGWVTVEVVVTLLVVEVMIVVVVNGVVVIEAVIVGM